MRRTGGETRKASPLYARIRQILESARQISDAPPRKSMLTIPRDTLPPIRHAVRSELGGAQTLKILYALRRGSLRPDGGASGTTDGRAGYGR